MKRNFNSKTYQGKTRLYTRVATNIHRIWVWRDNEYRMPVNGKDFYARRNRSGRTEYEVFASLPEARAWQQANSQPLSESGDNRTFAKVIEEYKRRKFPTLKIATRDQYEKLLRLYFEPIMTVKMNEFKPTVVDQWIDWLKSDEAGFLKRKSRTGFEHELRLLTTILNYYRDYNDDFEFVHPVKKRHRQDVCLQRERRATPKDITEAEFRKFREHLYTGPRGETMAALATIQFYHALRINEAAALHWEDLALNQEHPSESRLRVVRSVRWVRKKDCPTTIQDGFKNSEANNGVKEQALQPHTYGLLQAMRTKANSSNGLIFSEEDKPLEYRWIQYAYNCAFKAAGLPYRSTHIMRHGGTRKVYNETGDLAIAAQILGNTTTASVQVYARRNTNALNEHVQNTYWKKSEQPDDSSQFVAELVAAGAIERKSDT